MAYTSDFRKCTNQISPHFLRSSPHSLLKIEEKAQYHMMGFVQVLNKNFKPQAYYEESSFIYGSSGHSSIYQLF